MRMLSKLMVCGCVIVLSLCLAGCSSSNHGSATSGSSQAKVSQSAKASQESLVEDKFLGHWMGYDMYMQGDESNPILLSDMGASETMDVDADGTLDVHMTLNGGTIDEHLTLEKGASGNGYTLYDNGQVFGALEYDKNGPVNWLPHSDDGDSLRPD